ncbi:MAG: hypothetical protein ACP6IY_06175 [Promethearchaeia archaeon]
MSSTFWSIEIGFLWELTMLFILEGYIISVIAMIPRTIMAVNLKTENIIREKLNW